MKLVQAIKLKKDLLRKVEDLEQKIARYSVDLDYEAPTYGTTEQQRDQVKGWLQAHHDIVKEIEELSLAIARTNLNTLVNIDIGGKSVTKSITAWILRRGIKGNGLAAVEQKAWLSLTDRNLKDGVTKTTSGEMVTVKVRRYYDPAERDNKIELYRSEPSTIDGVLETVNAVTDLI